MCDNFIEINLKSTRASFSSSPNGSHAEKLPERVAQLESLVQATLGNIDSTAPPGVGALLQLVQAATRTSSSSVHPSMNPDNHNHSDITAVQTAAAALGQLSQQSAPPSSHSNSSFGGLIDYVRLYYQCHYPRVGLGVNSCNLLTKPST